MGIEYLPYFAIFAHINAKQRRGESASIETPLWGAMSEFRGYCTSRSEGLAELRADWAEGRPDVPLIPANEPWLYSPLCFQTLSGSSDGRALVLVDDFDAYHYIGSVSSGIVEEMDVAVCPDMSKVEAECFRMHPEVSTRRGVFCNIHELWTPVDNLAQINTENSTKIRHPERINSAPLLVTAQCKLEGILAMDLAGYLIQESLYSIAYEILVALSDLERNAESSQLYSLESVKETKICFLHGQGASEITVLVQGTNATVATCLVAVIRNLKVKDILDHNADLEAALYHILGTGLQYPTTDKWDWQLCDSFKIAMADEDASDCFATLAATPLFRWTLTEVGVAIGVADALEGWVSSTVLMQITPAGIVADETEQRCLRIQENCDEKPPEKDGYYLRLMGLYDAMIPASAQESMSLVTIRDLAEMLSDNLTMLTANAQGGLAGITRLLRVPVPKGWHFAKGEAQVETFCSRAAKVLAKCRVVFEARVEQLLAMEGKPAGPADWESFLSNADAEGQGIYKPLRLHLLQQIPKAYGLPQALRQSISALFHQYLRAVTDVHLFDLAIDLLDAFATLHHILCQILARRLLKPSDDSSSDGMRVTHPVHPQVIQRIASYSSALHRAFEQRIHRAYPATPSRGKSLDLQGDVHAFIQAADAPLKCGVGLVANETSCWAGMESRRRDVLGVFTSLGFTPGIKAVAQNLNIENHARIAFFDSDVHHLMQVGAYVDYLHESAHVVLETLVCHRDNFLENHPELLVEQKILQTVADMEENGPTRNRLTEIFVHAMTYYLVCPPDRALFLRNFIHRFSSDPENAGFPLVLTIHRFAEVFAVLYLGSYAISQKGNGTIWEKRSLPASDSLELRTDFDACFADASLWYGPYEHAESSEAREAIREYVFVHLRALLDELGDDVMRMLDLAWFAFSLTAKKQVSSEGGGQWEVAYATQRQAKLEEVLDCVNRGEMIQVHAFAFNEGPQARFCIGHDPLLLCGLLLHAYLYEMSSSVIQIGSMKYRVNLPQQLGSVRPTLEPAIGYHIFVSIHGVGSRTFLEPMARKARLKKQIAVLRSFWCMSSIFKARRFCALLNYAK